VATKSKPLSNDHKVVLNRIKDCPALSFYLLVLDILYVTYFLTSVTMSGPQTSDMRQMR